MKIPLEDDEIAYLCGTTGTLALARTLGHFFYLETSTEEIALFTDDDDLLVASTFEVGDRARKGLWCTLYTIREMNSPLIVLPRGHPASPRLKTVVSVGERTRIRCDIQAGTHPEQDVLCGTSEFEGVEVISILGGAEVKNFGGQVLMEKLL
ncbi:hypothetical protein [Methanocrinis sp.]|uniref:hypothetical protein n=1 Tax=Methanocrinis sp. TaxID=3101522 RepID=UPI003D12E6EB